MPVIVTAGHVDHGKSALVKALTGSEPDRWREERARGMSIGLGFVWTRLPSDTEVSFVDAPGHRRLVSTMLAGAAPAPAVLFVVAADEGWQAQSAEHLAGLDALGTTAGLLVVTKSDRADPAPALAAARHELAGTSLASAPACAVSALTGEGLPSLRHALDTLVAHQDEEADDAADVRLWVDRSFTVAGAGTVVTATLTGGTLRLGDRLRCVRTGRPLRVRGLQVCERPVAVARPVRRVAVNLAGTRVDVRRGDALVAEVWRPVAEFDVLVRERPRSPALTLHIGTAAVPVRVRALGEGAARLRAECELPVRPGDRLLLRDPGGSGPPVGAVVVDVVPEELARRGAAERRGAELVALASAEPTELAADLVRRKRFLRPGDFRAIGLPVTGHPVTGSLATTPTGYSPTPGWLADPAAWADLVARVPAELDRWRTERPLTPDIPLPVLTDRLNLPSPEITRELLRATPSTEDNAAIRRNLPEKVETALAELTKSLRRNPFRAPESRQLAAAGLRPPELAAAVRAGRLLQLAPGVVLLPGADHRAAEVLRGLTGPFTVSQAREAWDTTRRTAVPLLGLLDRAGVTRRRQDGARDLV
ncbi:SelB C-terminal domain-containing protein [Lentzea sp. NPDC058450]|uniref:SelB domain-containing protein n=1 Tax=Lentzea sp. NPDC058450 TaxID=3346505 RepID=UPI0036548146